MLIELKNVPIYGEGLKVSSLGWSTIDTFENIDIKLTPLSDSDSAEEYWGVRIESQNCKVSYRAPTPEKQREIYELVKSALLAKQEFLSIDFEEWK